MSDGAIHEISHEIGKLSGAVEGIRMLMLEHHGEADSHWDRIESEIRTVKHDQRNVEQNVHGMTDALKRIGDKVRPLEDLPLRFASYETNMDRIGVIEKKVTSHQMIIGKAVWLAGFIVSAGTAALWVVEHYGGSIVRFLATRF